MSNSEFVTNTTDSSFKEDIQKGGLYILDFWAEWCGPCKTMTPIFENLAETMNDQISFLSVNVDENPELSGQFGITSIPTFYIINVPEGAEFDLGQHTVTALRGATNALDFKLAIEKAIEASK